MAGKLNEKGFFMAEKRNLLDDFDDAYYNDSMNPLDNPLHPVEYRAALAKAGNKIGRKLYSLGGGSKGVSARDIIRKDADMFPYDIIKQKRDRQRIDPQNEYDFKIINKNNGDEHKIEVSSQKELEKKLDLYSEIFDTPKENIVVESNLKNPNAALKNKFQKHDFDKAFSGVRFYRDHDNFYEPVQDVLKEPHLTKESYEALVKKQNDKFRKYSVKRWQDYVNARNASRDAGHELGKLFAKKNAMEKNVYGNIAAGNGAKHDPLHEGSTPKYALGNQNHVYSTEPDKTELYHMDIDMLQKSGHPIHYRKDGAPIIDLYTWTQIPNIEKIKKTGYLAIEGADTKGFHPGTLGQWTASIDSYPMDKNYENGVEIFKRGNNGETFNEDLLHTRLPLSWYQKAPVIHQGPKGWGTKVDVIQAKPGASEVMVGEGSSRRLEKVATPAQFINHITEDNMRPDWAPAWEKEMLPGSHPNKERLGYNTYDALVMLLGRREADELEQNGASESKRALLDLMKDENNKRKLLEKIVKKEDFFDRFGTRNELKKNALKDYYNNVELGGKTAYDVVKTGVYPPKLGNGAILRPEIPNLWYRVHDDKDFPRTRKYLSQSAVDNKPLERFRYGSHYFNGNLLDFNGTPLYNAFHAGPDFKFGMLNHTNGLTQDVIYPDKSGLYKYEKQYLKDIGAGDLGKVISQRKGAPDVDLKNGGVSDEYKKKRLNYYINSAKAERSVDASNNTWPIWKKMSTNPETGRYDADAFNDAMRYTQNSKFENKQNFSFDDWFEGYKNNKGYTNESKIVSEKERLKPLIDTYLDEMKKLKSDKDIFRDAVNLREKYVNGMQNNDYKGYMKADSLDKVIGHMIGRRIGADRAKRGKKIF